MPSAPAAMAMCTAGRPCACAVTGRPLACAASTTARTSSRVNWHSITCVPVVENPPLVMILTRSTPRSARSRTAARS
jgi:hypothetical protein